MPVHEQRIGDRVVLTPPEMVVVGGAAEEFEDRIQSLLREGVKKLAIDLRHVGHVDSTGIRALVRGHTSAQREGSRFILVGPQPRVRKIFNVTRLDAIFDIQDGLDLAAAPAAGDRG